MTEIPTCPTCGRRPSERYGVHVLLVRVDFSSAFRGNGCPDPIHDLADQGPALKAERDEARAEVEHQKLRGDRLAERVDRIMAERDEARAMVMEMFQRSCGEWEHHDQGTEVRWLYDHMASSTLREAQAALISWGMVKREECVRE